MANFGDLLGSFLQINLGQSGQARMGNALEDLQANLGQMLGGQGGAGGLLDGILGMAKGQLGNAAESPLQAGGLGAVLGSMLGGGGDSIKGAMTGGALAMLAGVAFKALTNAGQGQGGAGVQAPFSAGQLPLGLKPPETAAEEEVVQDKARLILNGMINMAKADGEISVDEVQRIAGKAQSSGMGQQDQAWLMAQFREPLDLDAFVAEIPNQEVAAEVYAASLLAVEVDTDAERDYLRQFAQKTGLHPMVVQHIHASMGVAV
ncbi:tellurite resistance TerB family protein [Thiorhodococcus mannitoliphagus]|uniref:Tellurite resistance TerB family protein n=1 Tax=Thiorhodococcus mannitoliphagus TaxID=329406 RepID=A0A6P1DST4_9GAMM|nr:tellurite resistance TerB family protein [Thiorhodococcus mannitoliphagus]NEX19082.1 tellurite resistance TerB family protein [Thiorhodococcus mannitoliphagus]